MEDARKWVILSIVAALLVGFIAHTLRAVLTGDPQGLSGTWSFTRDAMMCLIAAFIGEKVRPFTRRTPARARGGPEAGPRASLRRAPEPAARTAPALPPPPRRAP